MKFSQFAGTSIVPTLSRLVLALAFVTTGYNKLMRDAEFNSAQAEVLRTLGVTVVKVTDEPTGDATAALGGPRIILASLQETPEEGSAEPAADEDGDEVSAEDEADAAAKAAQEAAAKAAQEAAEKAAQEAAEKAAEEAADDGVTGTIIEAPVTTPVDDGSVYTARSVHNVTLLCHANNWPVPKTLGFAAGITELLGGGLILIGFLTRIWALGLAITMGVAFYFVSMGFYGVHTVSPFDFAMDHDQFHGTVSQLALFVMSFGLFMTGAGAVSLDRLLFGRRGGGKKGTVAVEFDDMDNVPGRASRPM